MNTKYAYNFLINNPIIYLYLLFNAAVISLLLLLVHCYDCHFQLSVIDCFHKNKLLLHNT